MAITTQSITDPTTISYEPPASRSRMNPMSTNNITLQPATLSDLHTLVALQFQCFNHSVLIEQIINPDTPSNRAAMYEKHERNMHEYSGLKVVKAVVNPRDPGPAKTPVEDLPMAAQTTSPNRKLKTERTSDEERIVGFCMFYLPIQSPSDPSEVVLPPSLRAPPATTTATALPTSPSSTVPILDTAAITTAATATPSSTSDLASSDTTPISISRTNIPTLLPYRHNLVSKLLTQHAEGRGAGYVQYMSVDPSYRRHGIGRMLMQWGCALFDAAGVDAYLEATAEGEGLYRHFGFEQVGEQVLEVDGVVGATCPCMWRSRRS